MRVGLVHLNWNPRGGGAERSLAQVAQGLKEMDHQVTVVCRRSRGRVPPGVGLRALGGDWVWPRGLKLGLWQGRARRAMARERVDLWLAFTRLPGCQVVRTSEGCHATYLERRLAGASPLEKERVRRSHFHEAMLRLEAETYTDPGLRRVIAISQMVADDLSARYELDPAQVRVVYNGVDPGHLGPARDPRVRAAARAELGLAEGQKAILFLAQEFGRKGLRWLVPALAQVPGARLLVAGRDRSAPYEQLARERGVADRVSFLGERGDAPRLLAAADCLALPTTYDPMSVAVVEALWAGVPVVTSRHAGAAELIAGPHMGEVLDDPGDVDALGQALGRALAQERGFDARINTQEAWLAQVLEVLAEAAP